MKADFSDSSSTHNTGAVKIVNDIWKRCGWLTPPQKAYTGNYDVRIGVDGFPIDLFYDNDNTGENIYLGKYNFNNEKSGSAAIYGFEGIEGFNDAAALNGQRNKCVCLEFLNNSEALCLFGTADMASLPMPWSSVSRLMTLGKPPMGKTRQRSSVFGRGFSHAREIQASSMQSTMITLTMTAHLHGM